MKQGCETKKLDEVLVKTETFDPTKKPNVEFKYLDVSIVNLRFKLEVQLFYGNKIEDSNNRV